MNIYSTSLEPNMRRLLSVICIFFLLPYVHPVAHAQSGPRYNGPGSCASASSLGFAVDGVTDDEPVFAALATRALGTASLCVAIDCGKTMLFASQFVSPTTGTPNWTHPTYRITGCGGNPLVDATGSSILKLTYAGASNGGYQFVNVGGGASGSFGGALAIDNVVVTSTGTNPMFLSTLQVDVRNSAFIPANNTVTVFTLGGTNAIAVARTNSILDWFSGQYSFRSNRFIGAGTSIKTQSSTNSGYIVGNLFGDGGSNNIVQIDGASGGGSNDSRGIWISGNTFEVFTTGHCGIAQQRASSVYVVGNFFFDGPGGSQAVCAHADSKNGAYAWNFIDTTGIASGLTALDASNTVISPFDSLFQIPGTAKFQSNAALKTVAFSALGAVPAAGQTVYCTDCTTAATCAGSGSGHVAVSNGTNWTCQ